MGSILRLRVLAAAALCAMLPLAAGCGLVFGGTRQIVRVASSPDGAMVTTSPQTADYRTPAALNLERRHNYTLTLSAPGYSSQSVEIQRSIRVGIVVLDVIFGVVPVIIDAATGAWYRLSPDYAQVTLTRTGDVDGPDRIGVTIDLRSGRFSDELNVRSSAPGVTVHIRTR